MLIEKVNLLVTLVINPEVIPYVVKYYRKIFWEKTKIACIRKIDLMIKH